MNKADTRLLLRAKRDSISLERRRSASHKLFETLYPLLKPFPRILSFNSFPKEIDLSLLNAQLQKEGRVLFPEELDTVALDTISCFLVPGLGFDPSLMRIGYGKGFYDRLLAQTNSPKLGIAFQEQLIAEPLPYDPHDQKVDALYIF